jgi:hypothetical protein
LRDGCLKGLLGFHLLVENTESNILEIGDSWYFFVENCLLSNNIDKIAIFIVLTNRLLSSALLSDHFCETRQYTLIKDRKFAFVIFGKHRVNLPRLKFFKRLNELHWQEYLLLNLLYKLAVYYVRAFLEVNIVQEGSGAFWF